MTATATPTVRIGATYTLGNGQGSPRRFYAIVDGSRCGHSHRTAEAAQACAQKGSK